MPQQNTALSAISESFTIALADRVRALKAAGSPVIALQTGDPDFNTPQPIIQAAYEAMQRGETHYSDSRGILPLREAAAKRLRTLYAADYDPQREILMTHGAIHAYYVGLASILNPGDDVLIADPTWQTHANMVRVLRANPLRVAASAENGFLPTLDAWQAALTAQTVAIVLNSPNNPTGAVASRDYLHQLVAFAAAHDLYIISDEVYDRLVYDEHVHTCVAALPGAKERTLTVNSLSKTYAMTGWRVGYLAAPAHLIDSALKASQHSITNLAPFVQHAALEALTNPDVAQASAEMVAAYAARRKLVQDICQQENDTPLHFTPPDGAFYYFIDMRALNVSAMDAAQELLESANLAIVPGSAYGAFGEGFLRMTIAAHADEITAGTRALLAWARRRG